MAKKAKNIVVLGSEGQLGKPLVSFLKQSKYNVTSFDIMAHGDEKLDLREKNELLNKAISDTDFVIFLAFDVGGSRYLQKMGKDFDFISNNAKMMNNVFTAIKECEGKPFVFATSTMVKSSDTSYGCLKKLGEYYTNSLNGLSVRLWNVYGTEDYGDKSHVITDFVISAREKGEISCLTNGKERRQFLHVFDFCKAIEVIIENFNTIKKDLDEEELESIIDISSYEWTTIKQIAKEIGKQKNVPYTLSDKKDTFQNKDVKPDKSIFKKYWKPEISLKKGIRMIIEDLCKDSTEQNT